MPKAGFTPEYRQDTSFDYPVLKLDKNERARIVVIDPEPMVEFVHTLRSPEINEDGTPVMERREFGNGRSRNEVKRSFVGQHICFGDFKVLQDKGSDPERCATCRAAANGDGIDPPQARYAVHVLHYATKPGSFELQSPFSVTCKAWVLSAGRFGKLVDFATEHGDLRMRDLTLGPCENKGYQKYDINISGKAEWADQLKPTLGPRAALALEVFKQNRSEDLTPLIGRKVSAAQAQDDVMEVQTQYALLNGTSPAAVDPAANAAAAAQAAADVGRLLDEQTAGAADQVSADDLNSLLSGADAQFPPPPTAATAAPTPDPAPAVPAPTPAAPTAPVTPAQAPEAVAPPAETQTAPPAVAPPAETQTAPPAAAPPAAAVVPPVQEPAPAAVEETVVTPAATAAPAPAAAGGTDDLDSLMADLGIA